MGAQGVQADFREAELKKVVGRIWEGGSMKSQLQIQYEASADCLSGV